MIIRALVCSSVSYEYFMNIQIIISYVFHLFICIHFIHAYSCYSVVHRRSLLRSFLLLGPSLVFVEFHYDYSSVGLFVSISWIFHESRWFVARGCAMSSCSFVPFATALLWVRSFASKFFHPFHLPYHSVPLNFPGVCSVRCSPGPSGPKRLLLGSLW